MDRLRAARKATANKIPLREADDRDKVKLSYERKLFTDTVKLAACEIETRPYEMLGMSFRNSPMEGRGIIRALLSTSGNLRVTGDLIEVHLDQQSAPRCTLALQSLCQQLDALRPRLPETNHELRFHVKPRPIGQSPNHSNNRMSASLESKNCGKAGECHPVQSLQSALDTSRHRFAATAILHAAEIVRFDSLTSHSGL